MPHHAEGQLALLRPSLAAGCTCTLHLVLSPPQAFGLCRGTSTGGGALRSPAAAQVASGGGVSGAWVVPVAERAGTGQHCPGFPSLSAVPAVQQQDGAVTTLVLPIQILRWLKLVGQLPQDFHSVAVWRHLLLPLSSGWELRVNWLRSLCMRWICRAAVSFRQTSVAERGFKSRKFGSFLQRKRNVAAGLWLATSFSCLSVSPGTS